MNVRHQVLGVALSLFVGAVIFAGIFVLVACLAVAYVVW